jgi:hypothetical protein|tara:strand:- start:426 stop:689 length:264 start_codon:yes stop_codon:yes gene_type:complete
MKSKRPYIPNDKVWVRSFAGPDVWVILKERYIPSETEHKLGVEGWNAQLICSKEVNKLRKRGVPYRKGEKPMVWVFDWQILRRKRKR